MRVNQNVARESLPGKGFPGYLFFAVSLFWTVSAFAGLPLATPQSLDLPDTFTASLDRALEEGTEQGWTAGAEGLVVLDGKIVYHNSFGFLKKAPTEIALHNDALFDLASLTKVIVTTTSLLILKEEGKIDLDERVETYLPKFTGGGRERITLRQLLTHTSGLGNLPRVYDKAEGKGGYWDIIQDWRLKGKPGGERVYSDLGMMVAGFVVERVSGKPLDRFARDRIFLPLGMKRTFFNPPMAKRWRCASTERCEWRGRVMQGQVHDENAYAMGGVAGHAGLFSTAKDVATFAQTLLDGGRRGRRRILRPETVRKMIEPREVLGYEFQALGWRIQEERGQDTGSLLSDRTFGHTGFTGVSLWIDPDNNTVAILLMNAVHPDRKTAERTKVRKPFYEAVTTALEVRGGGASK